MVKKGRDFENKISNKLLKINRVERGFFIKSPTPIKMVKMDNKIVPIYSNKALCDFIGIYKSKFILIETKNIFGLRFEFNRLKSHQEKQLSSIKRHGGISFMLLNLEKLNKIILLEINDYLVFKTQTDKKSIRIEMLLQIGREIKIDEIEECINNLL